MYSLIKSQLTSRDNTLSVAAIVRLVPAPAAAPGTHRPTMDRRRNALRIAEGTPSVGQAKVLGDFFK